MGVGATVEMKVEDIANTIKRLRRSDKEMLLLLLSGEGREIARRLKDIKTKKVKTLSREAVLKDVL